MTRPTCTLTAHEYAFWLWGMFIAGLIVGCFCGVWLS